MGRKRRGGRKVDATGRSIKSSRFVKLDFSLLETSAYRSLSTGARALLVEFNRLYNGDNNGQLFLSQREAAQRVGVTSHATAAGYINELEDRGFIRARVKGSFSVKNRRATSYVLSQFEYNGQNATRDFNRWTPPQKQKPRVQKSTPSGAKSGPSIPIDWPDEGDIVTCQSDLHIRDGSDD